jgi:hypothetical protein
VKHICKTSAAVLAAALLGVGLCPVPAADPPASDGPLVVVDGNGKEHKIKAWKFVAGTRRLGWLAPQPQEPREPKPDKPRTATGPEALELRDDASLDPPLIAGFVTLIPLDRVRSLEFDDKDEMTVRVATDKADMDEVLTGSTKYRDINKITLEAEVNKGEMGVAAVKFQGGVIKGGIKAIRFPGPKGAPAPTGRAAVVTTTDKKRTAHKVIDLQALYRTAEGERLQTVLMFKKTLKVDLGKISKVRAIEGESKDADGPDWAVTPKDGEEETFTLLKQTMLDGKPAILEGLVGRTAVGYKLFPPGTIAEIQFEEAK